MGMGVGGCALYAPLFGLSNALLQLAFVCMYMYSVQGLGCMCVRVFVWGACVAAGLVCVCVCVCLFVLVCAHFWVCVFWYFVKF